MKSSFSESLLMRAERPVAVSGGGLHTLICTDKNRVFSAGHGNNYALGHGDTLDSYEF